MNRFTAEFFGICARYRRVQLGLAFVLMALASGFASAQVVNVSVSGAGAVGDDVLIFCAGPESFNASSATDCSADFTDFNFPYTVNLFTEPDSGEAFLGWGGDCASAGSEPFCELTFETGNEPPFNVSASFSGASIPSTFNVSVSGPGSVDVEDIQFGPLLNCASTIGNTNTCTTQITDLAQLIVTATPAPNAEFGGFFSSGLCEEFSANQCQIVVSPDGSNITVFADFFEPADVTLTADVSGPGIVFAQNESIFCGPESESQFDNCTATYTQAELIEYVAEPDQGEAFNGWGGACASFGSSPTCTLLISGTQTLSISASFGAVAGDSDGDGVPDFRDICPGTPAGEPVDENGCSESQLNTDSDGDGVPDVLDLCPNTPPGEPVTPRGCSQSQLDDDADGVPNSIDQCPNTPLGEPVDEFGCSESQREQLPDGDADGDGVPDDRDLCPNTPAGEPVDEDGCSASQRPGEPEPELDSDGDGVPDSLDQCPDTPPGEEVNADGCALSQLDSDGDGVTDDIDQCPNSDPSLPVNEVGCTEVDEFGQDLEQLNGLSNVQRSVASRIDGICEELTRRAAAGQLTEGQQQLQQACSSLKNVGTSNEQAREALDQIAPREIFALLDYSVEIANSQFRRIQTRLDLVRSGRFQRGVSVAGLNVRAGENSIPAHLVQGALDSLLGGLGASGDSGGSFGKLGLFIQGDLDIGKRRENSEQSAYKSETQGLTLGGDYRFRDNLIAGASLSYGSVDVNYGRERGSASVDNWSLASYASWQITEPWYVDALLSYGESDIKSTVSVRYTDSAGTFESLHRGSTSGKQVFAGLNTGYMFNKGGLRAGPIASIAFIDGKVSGFTQRAEGNSPVAWLFEVDSLSVRSLRFNAGMQADYVINTGIGVLIPGLRATYVMETEDGGEQLGVRFVHDPFAGQANVDNRIFFTTAGRDSRFLDFSLNLSGQFKMGFSGFLSYQFYRAYNGYSHDGYSVGVRWDKPF